MTNPLFCYGTLRSLKVMKAVTGQALLGIDAQLQHYVIYRVRGADYPGILPEKGGLVEGTLYRNIDEKTFRLLDGFEGEDYFRMPVHIVTKMGEALRAEVYCIREERRNVLTQEQWDFDHFLKQEIEGFMQRCFPKR